MPPSKFRDTVPEAVEEAVLTALAKLPADLYTTAAEVAVALEGTPDGGRSRRRAGSRSTRRARGNTGWGARLPDPVVLALGATANTAALFKPLRWNAPGNDR